MGRLAIVLGSIAVLAWFAADAHAQLPVNCAGAIQNCAQGKEMFCNRWKSCRKGKVRRYCDAPVCMTKKG